MDRMASCELDGLDDDDSLIHFAHEYHLKKLAKQFNANLPNNLETVYYFSDPGKHEQYYVFGDFQCNPDTNKYVCTGCLASTQYERMMQWNRRFSIDTWDLTPFLINVPMCQLIMHPITKTYVTLLSD